MKRIERLVRQWANCRYASVDAAGDIWIEGPQSGHWLSSDELERFHAWERGQRAPTYYHTLLAAPGRGLYPVGYSIEDVSQYDCGEQGWSFVRPDGSLGDTVWTSCEDAWKDAKEDEAAR